MLFELDKQTLYDLAIFQNGFNDISVFSLFNKTVTIGGQFKLTEIFSNPLSNAQKIQDRLAILKYFEDNQTTFDVSRKDCDFVEHYLDQPKKPGSLPKIMEVIHRLGKTFGKSNEDYIIEYGVKKTLQMLVLLQRFTSKAEGDALPAALEKIHCTVSGIVEHDDFALAMQLAVKPKLNIIDTAKLDYLFRHVGFERIKTLLDIVYEIDVLTTVVRQGKKLGFCLPVVTNSAEKTLVIKGLFHPFISNPVANDIDFDFNKNVCFVTGTNMAGKSTFLKSIGVAVYLSQLGFPVPAAYMGTSTFKGLISTINLSDDIHQGHSHFYNEVLRVKHVAQKLNEVPDILVIFDELFRGTNVKDAYDASLEIISAFAKMRRSFFVISTHIIEVAKDLAGTANINFKYMETTFDADAPVYSYQLKSGITEERLGLWIVKNEGITELIEKAIKKELE